MGEVLNPYKRGQFPLLHKTISQYLYKSKKVYDRYLC
jgi:hypothetical protein